MQFPDFPKKRFRHRITLTEKTVIRGTAKPNDLANAFLEEIYRLILWEELHKEFNRNKERWSSVFETAKMRGLRDEIDDEDCENCVFLIDFIDDIRFSAEFHHNIHNPQGLWFGSHPGSTSDYGWWPSSLMEC